MASRAEDSVIRDLVREPQEITRARQQRNSYGTSAKTCTSTKRSGKLSAIEVGLISTSWSDESATSSRKRIRHDNWLRSRCVLPERNCRGRLETPSVAVNPLIVRTRHGRGLHSSPSRADRPRCLSGRCSNVRTIAESDSGIPHVLDRLALTTGVAKATLAAARSRSRR